MPFISCFVKDSTMRVLEREAVARTKTVHELAEQAIESAAIATLPGGLPGGFDGQHFAPEYVKDLFEQIFGDHPLDPRR